MAFRIENREFIKWQPVERSLREYDKAIAAFELARETGAFRTPRPLKVDAGSGELRFELLTGFETLRSALARSTQKRGCELVERAARALAVVHKSLPLPSQRRAECIPFYEGMLSYPLHGDFTVDNLLYSSEADEIAVVDWSTAGWLGYDACIGPPCEDVASMLISLFNQRVVQRGKMRASETLATAFLSGYREASGGRALPGLSQTLDRKLRIYDRFIRGMSYLNFVLYGPELSRLRSRAPVILFQGGVV